jgi:drug/metabolite transporter (DMT)-like permease
MLALTSSLSWAVYTIVGKKISQKYGGVFSNGLSMFMGLMLFQPIFFYVDVPFDLASISTVNWLR